MGLLISLFLTIGLPLLIFKKEWFYSSTKWLFKNSLGILRFFVFKVLKPMGWIIYRFIYWLFWLMWELVLFMVRAFGVLFQMLFSR